MTKLMVNIKVGGSSYPDLYPMLYYADCK